MFEEAKHIAQILRAEQDKLLLTATDSASPVPTGSLRAIAGVHPDHPVVHPHHPRTAELYKRTVI